MAATSSTFEVIDLNALDLTQGDLTLVVPSMQWLDAMMESATRPASIAEAQPPSRDEMIRFIEANAGGRCRLDGRTGRVLVYHFWMKLAPGSGSPLVIGGGIDLRVGDHFDLRMYGGHIGYAVYPEARGRRLAERSVRLLLPLARAHQMRELWITCNPDNSASRRTCERLGARLVEIVPVPFGHELHRRGETHKCRYLLSLVQGSAHGPR